MSSVQTVPMISPDGQSGDIPADRVQDAVHAGFKTAMVMTAPDGSTGYIPHDRAMDAIKAGFKIGQANAQEDIQQPKQEGFISAAAGDLGNMAATVGKTVAGGPFYLAYQKAKQAFEELKQKRETGQTSSEASDAQRVQDGRSLPYRAAARVNEALGVNVQGMEQAADRGDSGGVMGHAVAGAVPYVAPIAIKEVAPAIKSAASNIADVANESRAAAAKAQYQEIRNLPAKAVLGGEDIYRAAAPVGSNPQFRGNMYAALGDLAEIGRKVKFDEAKGGFISPDLRPRATVNAINDYLKNMYDTERAPQIQRNAEVPVTLSLGEDAANGMEFLSKNAGQAADRALAQQALEQGVIRLADADKLARVVNKELLGYERKSASGQSTLEATSKNIAGLKDLDRNLGATLEEQLQARGEDGIKAYERRYAALSAIREQLSTRQNAVELQRNIPVYDKVKPLLHGKSGIASASQAAVADVNIGQKLESGFSKLADSNIQPNRVGKMPNTRIAGALPPAPTELPASYLPNAPSAAPPVDATTRAQRLGLLLPEQAGGPHQLSISELEGTGMTPGEARAAFMQMLREKSKQRFLLLQKNPAIRLGSGNN